MERVDAVTLAPLLLIAKSASEPHVSIAALDAASRFPLTIDAWQQHAKTNSDVIFSSAKGSKSRRDALALMVRVPLMSIRQRLRDMADNPEEPDRDIVIQALEQVGDSSRIQSLLEKVQAGHAWGFAQLAVMPLESESVTPNDIPALPEDASFDASFWRAIALSRVGDHAALDAFFQGETTEPELFWGSPWSAYDAIAAIRPIPEQMHDHLLGALELFADSGQDSMLSLTVWAATGIADAEGTPLIHDNSRGVDESSMASPPTPPSDGNSGLLPENIAARLKQDIVEANMRACELPPDAPAEILIGNEIVESIPAQPNTENWPVAELTLEQLGRERTALDDGQLAWVFAHAAPTHVIHEMIGLIIPDRPIEERLHILRLLGDTADHYAGRGASPGRGAGPTAGEIGIGCATLIDDLPQDQAMASPGAGHTDETQESIGEQWFTEESADFIGQEEAWPKSTIEMEEFEETMADARYEDAFSEQPEFDLDFAASESSMPDIGYAEAAPREPDQWKDFSLPVGASAANAEEATREALPPEAINEDERRVHAQILQEGKRRNTFLTGADNVIRCWIGLAEPERAAVAETAIPPISIPPEGLPLTVDLCWGNQSDQGRLLLPANRTARTGDCDLHLRVPDGERYVSAEIIFRFRGRAFEVVRVEAFALGSEEEEQTQHEIQVRVQVSKRQVMELPDSNEYDSTIVWGADTGPGRQPQAVVSPSLRVFGGQGSKRYELQDANTALDWLNQTLFNTEKTLVRRRAAETPTNTEAMLDAEDPDVLTLLRDMARHGTVLYNQLREQGFQDPGERIQLLNLEPAAYVPLEFIYDRGYPMDNPTLCDGWEEALLSDSPTCPACSQNPVPDDQRDWVPTICPLGFWSLQKIIERLDPDSEDAEEGVDHSSVPRPGHRELPIIDDMLFASSNRVPEDERQETLQALQENFDNPIHVNDWAEWKQVLKNRHPQLLLVLPHHGVEAALDYLQIGDEQLSPEKVHLSRGQLTDLYINPDGVEPGPIVLLLGCRTGADTEVGYVRLTRRFQRLKTSIVLGTLAKVLGKHAAPVARELVSELLAVNTPQTDFGTIMRRVRRRMLAEGYLMSLSLVALGDAEWHLTPRPKRASSAEGNAHV